MKIFIIGLIFPILFSNIPTKVWVCGLDLCPMSHHSKSQSHDESMPCHKNLTVQSGRMTSHTACPCPDTFVDTSYFNETRKQSEAHKTKLLDINKQEMAQLGQKDILTFHYKPPPYRSVVSLQIIHQVFLI